MAANAQNTDQHLHPNLFRRLAAMVYDLILLIAIIMICFIPIPLLADDFRYSVAGKLCLQGYIALILYVFFGWFWTHNGQTLGMRAWRMRVVSHDGTTISWLAAARRFALAILSFAGFGLGYLLSLFHADNMTLHDLYSGTKLVMVEKKQKALRKSVAIAKDR